MFDASRLACVLAVLLAMGPAADKAPAAPGAAVVASVAEDYWQHQQATQLAVRLKHGLPIESLGDPTHAQAEAEAAFGRTVLDRLAQVDSSSLGEDDRLSLVILRNDAQDAIDALPHWWVSSFTVTPYASPLPGVHLAFTSYAFRSAADRAGYLALLRRYPAYVAALQTTLEERARRGIRIPREDLDLTVPFIQSFIAEPERSLFQVSASRLSALAPGEAEAFRVEVAGVVASEVNPALARLRDALGPEYRRAAPEGVGLAQQPERVAHVVVRVDVLGIEGVVTLGIIALFVQIFKL